MKVLITGASGFVGEALVLKLLLDKKIIPVAAIRGPSQLQGLCRTLNFDITDVGGLPALTDVKVVIHAAARVHIMKDTAVDSLAEFRKTNLQGTLKLARHAAAFGVKRFIFLSSIKVNGECTQPGTPFTADDRPMPSEPYAISKYEAEEALKVLGHDTGMEIVIVRLPLVYGAGVKANFLSLLRWLDRGIPLPLGAIDNRRSLVSIGNLLDFLILCIDHPAAADNIFLVSDGEDLSTTQLLRRLANSMGKQARMLPVPLWLLNLAGIIFGKKMISRRLCESLQVSIGKNRELLGWVPPIDIDIAMRQTTSHYLERQKK